MLFKKSEGDNLTFQRPTWNRFFRLLKLSEKISVIRFLEYDYLASNPIHGCTLDVGGGQRVKYFKHLYSWSSDPESFSYESINIDPSIEPTYLIDPNFNFPVAKNKYDTVISLNTLEHIYEVREILSEIYRVLKPGGKFCFSVPFIFYIHAHPHDYTRGTASFWARILREKGFREIKIEVLSWGPFSTGLLVSGAPGPLKGVRKRYALLLDMVYYQLRFRNRDSNTWREEESICNAPLGYFISALK